MSWFPLCRVLMEDSNGLRRLTHNGKIYYLYLMSEYNRRGPFYKTDEEISLSLWISKKTISRTRRTIQELRWLYSITGTNQGNKPLATEYQMMKWAKAKMIRRNGEGPHMAMDRHTFDTILRQCGKHGPISKIDAIVCIYLYYWHGIHFRSGSFHIHKGELAQLTGVCGAHGRVEKIRQAFCNIEGAPAFSVENHHHSLDFTGWGDFVDTKIVIPAEMPPWEIGQEGGVMPVEEELAMPVEGGVWAPALGVPMMR